MQMLAMFQGCRLPLHYPLPINHSSPPVSVAAVPNDVPTQPTDRVGVGGQEFCASYAAPNPSTFRPAPNRQSAIRNILLTQYRASHHSPAPMSAKAAKCRRLPAIGLAVFAPGPIVDKPSRNCQGREGFQGPAISRFGFLPLFKFFVTLP